MLQTSEFGTRFDRIPGILTVIVFVALLSPSAFSSPVSLQNATATFSQTCSGSFPASAAIDGSIDGSTGWAIIECPGTSAQTAVFQTVTDQGIVGGTLFTFNLYQSYTDLAGHTLGDFRLSVTTDSRSNFADGLQTGGNVSANWIVLSPSTAIATNGATLTIEGDGSILASGTAPATSVYTVMAPTLLTGITGIRLEVLKDASLPGNGPGRFANGNFVLSELTVDAASAVPEPGTLGTLATALLGFCVLLRKRLAR
jgi:hypothetical protein